MALKEYFEFHDRTKVIFGAGTLEQAGREAARLGGTRALVVTDGIIRGLGFADAAAKSLTDAGVEVTRIFDEVPQDSGVEMIQSLYEELKEQGGADVTVAVGGGSVLDTAKLVNLLLSEGGDLMKDHQGAYLQARPLKPLIAAPTTAGTGSEVTFAAVAKDHANHVKVGFVSHYFAPDVALLDPKLTLSMPPSVTAATGMDALTHALESLVSSESEPVAEALACGAIRRINTWLPVAVADGGNIEARGEMLIASMVAGLAFTNTFVGIVHAIAHSMGGVAGVPHGLANSLILPYGMEFNIDFCADKYALAAYSMGVAPGGDERADAEAAIAKVRDLIGKIGLPVKLSEAGVAEDQLDEIAMTTMGDGALFTNPRFPEDYTEVLELLKKAF